jgi:trehalose utilization protein
MLNITIWNEYEHEKNNPTVAAIYPKGIHGALADALADQHFNIRTATLDQPEHGLTDEVLKATDVLIWWGHLAHDKVDDAIVEKVIWRVLDGMGLIVLHSGHASKIFSKLLGTPTSHLKWREADEKERIWVIDPSHPIAAGIGEYIELPQEEMYGEHFHIPTPDELVFVSWFEGGEVFRSGVTYRRGRGKIFYFRPGHETYPTYYNKDIQRVLHNAALWAAPNGGPAPIFGNVEPLENLTSNS